jgi:hypothetical protein
MRAPNRVLKFSVERNIALRGGCVPGGRPPGNLRAQNRDITTSAEPLVLISHVAASSQLKPLKSMKRRLRLLSGAMSFDAKYKELAGARASDRRHLPVN